MYLVRQIHENTDGVVSVLTVVLVRNLKFLIKMYLVRQIHVNTDRVISGLTLTKVLVRNLEFLIELYLVRQIPKDTKGYTWIGTDLNVFIGVGIYYKHSRKHVCIRVSPPPKKNVVNFNMRCTIGLNPPISGFLGGYKDGSH